MKAAEGTTLPLRLIDVASSISNTRVDLLVLNGSLEEAFARLASQESVVVSTDFIPADGTQFFDHILGIGLVTYSSSSWEIGARFTSGACWKQIGSVQIGVTKSGLLIRLTLVCSALGHILLLRCTRGSTGTGSFWARAQIERRHIEGQEAWLIHRHARPHRAAACYKSLQRRSTATTFTQSQSSLAVWPQHYLPLVGCTCSITIL